MSNDDEFHFSDEEDFHYQQQQKKEARQGKKGLKDAVTSQGAALENEAAKSSKTKTKLGTTGRRKRTNVYSFGEAQYSKLGHDKRAMVSEPELVGALLDKDVVDIVYSTRHALALTSNGHIYSWGYGGDGQLGHGDQSMQPVPRLMTSLSKEVIVKVAAGEVHSAAINRYGQLLTWGDSPAGQLGHGDYKMQVRPKVVEGLFGHTVIDVSCGNLHTMCVTEDGKVFTMGSGLGGRLGHGDEDERTAPTLVEGLEGKGIQHVTCDGAISLALTAPAPVYPKLESAGRGDSKEEEGVSTSQKIRSLELQLAKARHEAERANSELNRLRAEVKKWEYEVTNLENLRKKAMSENLKLSFEKAEGIDLTKTAENQRNLMRQELESFLKLPPAFEELYTRGVKQIATGKGHMIALLDNGEVKAFGENGKGQLGLGHKKKPGDMRTVGKLRNKAIKMIAAGDHHSMALTYAGDVYTWGSSGNGQCGLGKKANVTEPMRVNFKQKLNVRIIGAGSKHSVALTADGEVYVWGRVDIGFVKGGGAGDKVLPTHLPSLTRHVKAQDKDVSDSNDARSKISTGNMTTNDIKELLHVHHMDAKDVVEMLPNITEDSSSQLLLTKEVNKQLLKDVRQLKFEMKEQEERFLREEKEFRNNQARAMQRADEEALIAKRKEIDTKRRLLRQRKNLHDQLEVSVETLAKDVADVTKNMQRVNREKDLAVSQANIEEKAGLKKSLDDILHDLEVARGLKDSQLASSRKELESAKQDIEAITLQLDGLEVETQQFEKYGLTNQLKMMRNAVDHVMTLREKLGNCTIEKLNTAARKTTRGAKTVQGLTSILDRSNSTIASLVEEARVEIGKDEKIDPVVRNALAQLIVDNAELRKQVNDYTWGLMQNTVSRHEQLRAKVEPKALQEERDALLAQQAQKQAGGDGTDTQAHEGSGGVLKSIFGKGIPKAFRQQEIHANDRDHKRRDARAVSRVN